MKPEVITRFAPSPTGDLHIGVARTALFNFLFSKQQQGKCHLRLENTDKERSTQEAQENILRDLDWLGISFDTYDNKPFVVQSDNVFTHKQALQKLIDSGAAFEAEEAKDNSGKKVVRFKNPNKEIIFSDLIRGEVRIDTTDLGDFVIAKGMDEPLYHLGVVVDDGDMGITHVIRGEDLLPSTPRQILIQEALGLPRPIYAHIPLILAPDRSKLSKRHGATSVDQYRKQGFLPEALVNYLALLGWHPKGEQEIFSLEELIEQFDIADIQKGGAIFDREKLQWINKEHIKHLSDDVFKKHIAPYHAHSGEMLNKILPIIREHIQIFSDVKTMDEAGELAYFFEQPTYNAKKLLWKDTTPEETQKHIKKVIELLSAVDDFSAEKIKTAVWDYATQEGRGNVLWPMRMALSGRDKSPDPFTLAEILGKEETLKRIRNAQKTLS